MDNNEDNNEDNIYLKIGKQMRENIYIWNYGNDYNVIYKKKYNDYKNEYINKLNNQIILLEESYRKISCEIDELERKNLELFVHITKNINFKYQSKKFFGFKNVHFNKSFTFNINKSSNSLDSEKYKLNLITINKLKIDRDIIYSSLEKTKSYKMKYET